VKGPTGIDPRLFMPPKRQPKRAKAEPLRKTPHKTPDLRLVEMPAADLDVLADHLGFFVRRIQVWIFQDFIRRLSSVDVSPAQFSVLVVIGANAGLSQSELATTLIIEPARLVRLLHRLERRGLIQRMPSSRDGRRHALRLTRDGVKLVQRAKSLAADHEAAVQKKFGEQTYQRMRDMARTF
jgi:DNA-binding MarR family transcriptional regulator